MKCLTEDCFSPIENYDTCLCASCGRAKRKLESKKDKLKKKPVMKVSKKMSKKIREYVELKREWIKGKMCAVIPGIPATDVHHMKGRIGYADQWAKDNGIPLLIDDRYWLPVSRGGHMLIETSPVWAKKKGYSFNRL